MDKHEPVRIPLKDAPYIKEVTWHEVRNSVANVNPKLAAIIDAVNPGKELTLIRARYEYGADIRQKGKLFLPNDAGKILPIDNPLISDHFRKKLDYAGMPLALILDKATEVYVETPEKRTIPFKVFQPGSTVGVWSIMHPTKIWLRQGWDWSFSSGVRTMFMAPRITDAIGHRRLQKHYGFSNYLPQTIYEHQPIFREIVNQEDSGNWYTDILFFTNKWVEENESNLGLAHLKAHWYQEAWEQLHHWTARMIVDFNWEAFIAELSQRKIRLNTYLLDTLKHLIAIGSGTIPGFRIADDSQVIAPTSVIQKAYVDIYKLKSYKPSIIYPDFLTPNDQIAAYQHVYYSLNTPTLPEKPPEGKNMPSVMKRLHELKILLEVYFDVTKRWPSLDCQTQPNRQYDLIDNIEYTYFHQDNEAYAGVRTISDMLSEDPSLTQCPFAYVDREFPRQVAFFEGCVRVTCKPTPVEPSLVKI